MPGKIVVIGGSQGALQGLRKLVLALSGFSPPILVVQHIGAGQSLLPGILNDVDGHRAAFAQHGEPLAPRRIYVAPPDHHMLVFGGRVELSRGPRENWARPAVDPLFRSAAYSHGADVIGVILSGRLNDGTAGLYEIKRHGGVAIVQTPQEAEAPDMPRSALENVAVDYCLPVEEIPRLLARLATEPAHRRPTTVGELPMTEPIVRPTAQTCPECGGAMEEEKMGSLTRFRCHIGHVMTAQVLAAGQLQTLEDAISSVLRLMNERTGLCHEMAEKCRQDDNARAAEAWDEAAEEALRREAAAKALVGMEWSHPEVPA